LSDIWRLLHNETAVSVYAKYTPIFDAL